MDDDITVFYLAGVCSVELLIVGLYLAVVYVAGDGLTRDVGAGAASRGGQGYATGFSLFELLIVVTFSGLLVQQAMVWKSHDNDRSMAARTVRDIEQLRIALLSYYAAYNSYPPGLDPTAMQPSQPQFLGSEHMRALWSARRRRRPKMLMTLEPGPRLHSRYACPKLPAGDEAPRGQIGRAACRGRG